MKTALWRQLPQDACFHTGNSPGADDRAKRGPSLTATIADKHRIRAKQFRDPIGVPLLNGQDILFHEPLMRDGRHIKAALVGSDTRACPVHELPDGCFILAKRGRNIRIFAVEDLMH